ncbi:MAG: toxin [Spirochaetaceae bacterium]|nr:toxin [Spirochaetaceae bacterium]
MDIIWDEDKNLWLQLNRDTSFEIIADKILNKQYIDILENPTREEQLYFIMQLNNYTWVVPFFINEKEEIVLKTAFQSRKYHKKYGGK